MKVFYRIYPGSPENRPFANGDKRRLMRTCLCSFVQSCHNAQADVELFFLLDGCPGDWVDIVHHAARDIQHMVVTLDGIGNKPSFLTQLEMSLDGRSNEFVYFAEDDYLYRPIAVAQMLAFNKVNDSYITPYDHPDRYSRGDDRIMRSYVEVVGDWHWRTVESTTMTFGADRRVIVDAYDVIQKYACEGRKMWYPILGRGRRFLWSPIPSLATHVHSDFLAPCVDWDNVWDAIESR